MLYYLDYLARLDGLLLPGHFEIEIDCVVAL
jgi:hypothetical protein